MIAENLRRNFIINVINIRDFPPLGQYFKRYDVTADLNMQYAMLDGIVQTWMANEQRHGVAGSSGCE
jgi:hypothetical protein